MSEVVVAKIFFLKQYALMSRLLEKYNTYTTFLKSFSYIKTSLVTPSKVKKRLFSTLIIKSNKSFYNMMLKFFY